VCASVTGRFSRGGWPETTWQHGVAGLRQVVLGAEPIDRTTLAVVDAEIISTGMTALRIRAATPAPQIRRVGHRAIEQDQVDRLALEKGHRLRRRRGRDAVGLALSCCAPR
jgi:hypothetical protein